MPADSLSFACMGSRTLPTKKDRKGGELESSFTLASGVICKEPFSTIIEAIRTPSTVMTGMLSDLWAESAFEETVATGISTCLKLRSASKESTTSRNDRSEFSSSSCNLTRFSKKDFISASRFVSCWSDAVISSTATISPS